MPTSKIIAATLVASLIAMPALAQDVAGPQADFPWDGLFISAVMAGLILFFGWHSGRVTGIFVSITYILALMSCARNYPVQPVNEQGVVVATAAYLIALFLLAKVPMTNAMKAGLIAVAVAGSGYAFREAAMAGVRESLPHILDRDEANQLKVSYVDAPLLAFIPLVGPSSWEAFVFLSR